MNHTCLRRGLSLLQAALLSVSLVLPAAAAEPPDLSGISVSLGGSTEITFSGSSLTMTAAVIGAPEDTELTYSYEWSSSNTSAATVSGSGDTVAVDRGSTPGRTDISVTVTVALVSDPSVTVTKTAQRGVLLPGITLSGASFSLKARETRQLTATLYVPAGSDETVTWSSSSESVAAVSSGGLVTAQSAGTAAITAVSGGYSASCTVTVQDRTASAVTASTRTGSALSFSSLASSLDDKSLYVLGSSLSYVTNLSVPTTSGTLYYGYVSESVPGAGVGSNENYDYAGAAHSKRIEDVFFVPKNTFSGTATIQYTGYSASGDFFHGTIQVSVSASSSVISYSTSGQNRVDFQVSDFAAACQARTGYELSYVTFSLPAATKGTLYYNYGGSSLDNKVSAGTAYYRGKNPALASVSFVPASKYSGAVTIPFQGWDTAGSTFSGRVEITVSGSGGAGSIHYSTSKNTPVTFDSDDFDDLCEELTDSRLSRVRFTLPSSSVGTLYYNYTSSSRYDSKVSSSTSYYRASSPYLYNVSFVPASGWTGTVRISFTGYSTDGDSFSGTVSVTVGGTGSNTISYSTAKNTAVTFDSDDFDDLCEELTDSRLSRVRFTLPSSSVGTLYYNYTSSSRYDSKVSSSTSYYRASSPYLYNVSFVPATGWTGTVSIAFTGYSTDGDSFSGTVSVTVGGARSNTISYSTAKNTAVTFDSDDFDDLCEELTDSRLSRVRFTLPSSSVGTLYYNYTSSSRYDSKVSSSTSYYRASSPYLYKVSFVPATGWTGTVSIAFTGYSTDGDSFSGTVSVTVGGAGSNTISYSTAKNTPVTFDSDDFDDLSEELTDSRLSRVRFTLPSSSVGTLYYNYTSSSRYDSKVSSSTSYYRASSPYLYNVSFVPASGWTGTVSISFTGYSTDGDSFSGTVSVTVGGTGSNTISYSTAKNTAVTFDSDDFDDLCEELTDSRLSRVRFTLPSSSVGTLYYNYTSSSRYDSKVSSSTSYYRASSPYLYNVSFVPASGWTGTVSISFTGYSTGGDSFSGTVSVAVAAAADAGVIYYTASAGASVVFRLSSFQTACNTRNAGSFVSAAFSLPSAAFGQLRNQYVSASQPGTAISAGQAYSASGTPSVSSVSFVPAAGFAGTASISYQGLDSQGKRYDGVILITVPAAASSHFTDLSGYSWAAPSIEYLYGAQVVYGTGTGIYSPAAPMTRGSFMLMLCRAFHFSAAGGAGFADVPADSYYAGAVNTAQALGIAQGDGSYFYPASPMTREQAAAFLLRAMRADGWTISDGTRADLAGYADGAAVSDSAASALGAMVRLGIFQGGTDGRLNPGEALTRAEMAVILYRALTLS